MVQQRYLVNLESKILPLEGRWKFKSQRWQQRVGTVRKTSPELTVAFLVVVVS